MFRPEKDQQIIEVVGKGYVLDQTLVRPAKVRVGRHLAATLSAVTPWLGRLRQLE